MSRKIKKYGWIPDLPDQRDHLYATLQPVLAKLPKEVDLRTQCPPVFNQGELGSCTANAIAVAHQFDQMKQNKPTVFTPSRLFIYYNEREIEGNVKEGSGAMIRDGIKSLVYGHGKLHHHGRHFRYAHFPHSISPPEGERDKVSLREINDSKGAAPETTWPYDISKFATKPPHRGGQLMNQNNPLARHTGGVNFALGLSSSKFPTFSEGRYPAMKNTTCARTKPKCCPAVLRVKGNPIFSTDTFRTTTFPILR